MKFADIKPFIKSGNYEVTVFFNTMEMQIKSLEDSYKIQFNAPFQRGHVWTEKQQIAYVEYILRGGVSARTIYFNSPAFGVKSEQGDLDDTILCVDGLQRITAVRRFLNNEIRVFGHYYKEYEDSPGSMRTTLNFNINSLPNMKDVLEWYVQMNSGGVVHTAEEIQKVKDMIKELEANE